MPRSIDANEVRGLFKQLHVRRSSGQRAPNKPLLALWSIRRCIEGQRRLVPFALVDKEVGELIREFGPPRAHIHAEYPFWRLKSDGIWEIESATNVRLTVSGNPYIEDLCKPGVLGGFSVAIYHALRNDKALAEEVAYSLLKAHFPSTHHADVLDAAGIAPKLELVRESLSYRRDSRFRRIVLETYKELQLDQDTGHRSTLELTSP